jgi:hypothetical protein
MKECKGMEETIHIFLHLMLNGNEASSSRHFVPTENPRAPSDITLMKSTSCLDVVTRKIKLALAGHCTS